MDALRCMQAVGDKKYGITDADARYRAVADALRDIADELENGTRVICEVQTFEQIGQAMSPHSILHMVTRTTRLPKRNPDPAEKAS